MGQLYDGPNDTEATMKNMNNVLQQIHKEPWISQKKTRASSEEANTPEA